MFSDNNGIVPLKDTIIPVESSLMDQIKIGQYIANKRKAHSLTQEQLAEKLGRSRKAVSKWERGVSQS